MSEFLNADKLQRAKNVVFDLKGTPYTEESVEKRALAKAIAEGKKPKSDEAVARVYELIGGATAYAAPAEKRAAKAVASDGSELLDEKSEGTELEELQADGTLTRARAGKRGK